MKLLAPVMLSLSFFRFLSFRWGLKWEIRRGSLSPSSLISCLVFFLFLFLDPLEFPSLHFLSCHLNFTAFLLSSNDTLLFFDKLSLTLPLCSLPMRKID
ncbi:hypothetical protein DER46DRAFT_131453 [Fusarium sp. MPI-SDFR-AT-0072]|nr:hypothetical protein DER46DRAFT_131453 [Fusarium sp. MPI-SDFR-AT-0072]